MANKNTSLNVGIVGAGIAGLSAAIGLSHAGHVVEVNMSPFLLPMLFLILQGL